MRITTIEVSNFRGVSHAVVKDITGSLFLTGYTGQGKSSILHAVQMVLFGRCYDHVGKRIELADLVGPEAKTARVSLGLDVQGSPLTATLSIGRTKSSLGVTNADGTPALHGSPKEIRAALWRRGGVDARHAECAANPRAYLLSDDLAKLLADLGGQFDRAAVEEYCGSEMRWLDGFLNRTGLRLETSEDLATLGSERGPLIEARRGVKKRIAEEEAVVTHFGDAALPVDKEGHPIRPEELDALRKHLTHCEKERDALQRELGAAGSRRDPEAVRADLEKAKKALAVAERKRQESGAECDEITRRQEGCQNTITEARRQESELRAKDSALDGELGHTEREIDGFASGSCSRCSQAISAGLRAELIGPAEARRDELVEKRLAIEQERLGIEAKIESTKADAPSAEAVEAAREKRRKADASHTKAAEAVRELEAETKRAGGRTPDEVEEDLAACDGRIMKYREAIEALDAVIKRGEAESGLESLRAELGHLEWAVSSFVKGGALNDLSVSGREEFLGRCNTGLAAFGYEVGASVQGKDVTVWMRRADTEQAVPVSQVSGGELTIAQWAVATAFASDAPVLIDGLDSLDAGHKWNVFDSLAQTGRTVILAGAWGQGERPDVDSLGVQLGAMVAWVERGSVA